MQYIHSISPFKTDPEKQRIRAILPTIEKQSLIGEIEKAIHEQNREVIDLIQTNIPLKTLENIVPLNDILEKSREEALFLPKPEAENGGLSPTSFLPSVGFFGKVSQYAVETVSKSYGIDIDSPPKSSWAAQSQLQIFRNIALDSLWVFETALSYFVTVQKTALAALGAIAALFGIKKVYSYLQLGVPEVILKNQATNLTSIAQTLKKAIGRSHETQQLITALTPTFIEKPKIALLVGKPGVGKTQLVENLAVMIHEGTAPTLTGKKLFSVNTASLLEHGSWNEEGYMSRLDSIFLKIEGHEKEVILFFDEAHNAADKGENGQRGSSLIEVLKTKLLERNVSAILATTEEEYRRHIAPNKPFVERTEQISMEPLSEKNTGLILKEAITKEQIDVSSDAVETILEVGRTTFSDRANPRKSFDILQKSAKHLYAWEPATLQSELESEEVHLRELKETCKKNQAVLPELKEKQKKTESLRASLKAQKLFLEKIRSLRSLKREFFKAKWRAVHELNKSPNDSLKKDYLFLSLLTSTVEKVFLKEVRDFEKTYSEKIPLEINASLIRKLYPEERPKTFFNRLAHSMGATLFC